MMTGAYYNEIDPQAAAWLRELIKRGAIADGEVDERSIVDVRADELAGFTQCHFFAGIGVWSYALRNAGWPDDRPVWTGSCPCQPFSSAGKQSGAEDERHLWPIWCELINECQPARIFGEQVASSLAVGRVNKKPSGIIDETNREAWLDAVQADLENARYACGPAITTACGFGAPHIRQRLYFIAERMANDRSGRLENALQHERNGPASDGIGQAGITRGRSSLDHGMEYPVSDRLQGRLPGGPETGRQEFQRGTPRPDGSAINVADPNGGNSCAEREQRSGQQRLQPQSGGIGDLADTESGGRRVARDASQPGQSGHADGSGVVSKLGNADSESGERRTRAIPTTQAQPTSEGRPDGRHDNGHSNAGEVVRPGPTNGFWGVADWLYCRDDKWRPVESGTFPLVDGTAESLVRGSDSSAPIDANKTKEARTMRLRGYGNAINAEQAAEFVSAYLDIAPSKEKL